MAWKDATKHLGGKSPKKGGKEIREIRTRRGKSGGYIHEHHHMDPEANPMEEHTSPDQAAMLQHMMTNMPDQGGDPNAAAAAPAAPAGPPAAAPAGPPAPPGAM